MKTLRFVEFCAIIALGAIFAPAGAADRLPNVVLVYADDLGYGDLGCYGAKGYTTPNLDRMAREGCSFTRFYVARPSVPASRTALVDGLLSQSPGHSRGAPVAATHGIHDNEMTLASSKQRATPRIYDKWH